MMENNIHEMQRVLDAQKKHFINEGVPSIELRIDRLNRLKNLIMDNRYDFVDALNEDYGNRSKKHINNDRCL
jgi:coniferyl-aldehyde dehydrogenase